MFNLCISLKVSYFLLDTVLVLLFGLLHHCEFEVTLNVLLLQRAHLILATLELILRFLNAGFLDVLLLELR